MEFRAEGSHSGLVRPPAKRVTGVKSVEGSNPSPSATPGSVHDDSFEVLPLDRRLPDEQGRLAKSSPRASIASGCTPPTAWSAPISSSLNTCSVRQHAEDRAYSKLGRVRELKRERPELKVAVMGCMVGLKTDDLQKRFPQVDVFARPQQFDPIMALDRRPARGPRRRILALHLRRSPRARRAFVPGRPRLQQVLHLLHRPLPARPRKEPRRRRIVREVAYLCAARRA